MVWASTIDQPISFLAFLRITAGSAAFFEIFFFLYFGLAAVGFLCSEYAISQLYSFLFRHAQPVWDDFKQYPKVAQSTGMIFLIALRYIVPWYAIFYYPWAAHPSQTGKGERAHMCTCNNSFNYVPLPSLEYLLIMSKGN